MEASKLMQCIITEKQSYQIKKHPNMMKQKRAHDPHIVRAKENLKLSYGEPNQGQTSGTNQRIN